jgi:hypothetical protein
LDPWLYLVPLVSTTRKSPLTRMVQDCPSSKPLPCPLRSFPRVRRAPTTSQWPFARMVMPMLVRMALVLDLVLMAMMVVVVVVVVSLMG